MRTVSALNAIFGRPLKISPRDPILSLRGSSSSFPMLRSSSARSRSNTDFPRQAPGDVAAGQVRRPHIPPANAAPSPPSTAGASRKGAPSVLNVTEPDMRYEPEAALTEPSRRDRRGLRAGSSSYPEELIHRACEGAGIGPGAAVLEIGCGTGQGTRHLLRRGLRVTAVEPGRELITLARAQLSGLGDVQVRDAAWRTPRCRIRTTRRCSRRLRSIGSIRMSAGAGRPTRSWTEGASL